VIAQAEPDGLRLALTAAVGWEKYDGRSEDWIATDAPSAVAKAVLATAQDWSEIPILTGIVEAPALRPDGTVLDRPGYDPATGLLFDPGGTEFPQVPHRPTRQQAERALAMLREIISGFPFVGGESESAALSGLITPRVRKACRAVPLHAISAPKMASGKTLLASLAGYIGSGREPAMMSQADDPTDERKRLLAVLLEGQEVNVIDNVERELKSDALCTALTASTFSDRLLGASKTVTVASAATWFVTGNNLVVAGDLTARAISCALDPACERPEEREFKVDLHKVVPERRAALAIAALTIVRAYLAASEPDVGIPNFARFEDWSRFVRRPLVWLGMEDPCRGRERIEGRDPVRAQLGALLQAWHENYPGEAATVAEAIKLATRQPAPNEPEADTERRQRLHEALSAIGEDGRHLSARSIGRFITKHESRIEDGLSFSGRPGQGGIMRWRVR
jgi:putative DNA primase/helicase